MKSSILLSMVLLACCYNGSAQNILTITASDNTVSQKLSDIESLKFSDRNIRIALRGEDELVYSLFSIEKISFEKEVLSVEESFPDVLKSLSVYPNPASAQETLRLRSSSKSSSPVVLTLYGMDGMLKSRITIPSGSFSEYSFTFPTHCESGLYILVIQQDDLVQSEKLILQ